MYPNPPDWNSAAPQSGWYITRVCERVDRRTGCLSAQSPTMCGATGWDMLSSLQTELAGRLGEAGSLPDWNGMPISSVPLNDPRTGAVGWNRQVLQALWAVAATYQGVPASSLAAIQADADSGASTVSVETMQVGFWIGGVTSYSGTGTETGEPVYGIGSPTDIQIPEGTSPPRTDVAPPMSVGGGGSGGRVVCNALSADAANLIPVVRTVSPFRFSVLAAFSILALAVGAVVVLSRDVPVYSKKAKKNPSRPNPSRIHRRRSRRRRR